MLWMVLIIYGVWCAALYFMQDGLIFPHQFAGNPSKHPITDDVETFWIDLVDIAGTEDVPAWFCPAPNASTDTPAPVVIFFHGNAELIDHQSWIVQGYHELGVSVLLPEFRGYGRAGGKPSQKAIVGDALVFYKQLIERDDVDADRIIMHGRSIGGAVAAQVAAKQEPNALILQGCPKSVTSFAWKYGVPPFLVTNPFQSDKVIPKMNVPILFFHGSEDTIVPPANTAALEKLAKDARRVTYPVGHNDFPGTYSDEHWEEIERFLREKGVIE